MYGEELVKHPLVTQLIKLALQEDLNDEGDITSLFLVPENTQARAVIYQMQGGLLCGLPVTESVFNEVDSRLTITRLRSEGTRQRSGTAVVEIKGDARSILSAERVALNFLGRMSGVATLTNSLVKMVDGLPAKIYDTRKTIPGWRILDKYAVKVGGGENHRLGLYDMVLIKDNHWKITPDPRQAIQLIKERYPNIKIEIEVHSLEQLKEVVKWKGIDVIMADNMPPSQVAEAVRLTAGQIEIEASGGINKSSLKDFAQTGVQRISLGLITDSAPSLDFSLEIE